MISSLLSIYFILGINYMQGISHQIGIDSLQKYISVPKIISSIVTYTPYICI